MASLTRANSPRCRNVCCGRALRKKKLFTTCKNWAVQTASARNTWRSTSARQRQAARLLKRRGQSAVVRRHADKKPVGSMGGCQTRFLARELNMIDRKSIVVELNTAYATNDQRQQGAIIKRGFDRRISTGALWQVRGYKAFRLSFSEALGRDRPTDIKVLALVPRYDYQFSRRGPRS